MISTMTGSGTYPGAANFLAQLMIMLIRTPKGSWAKISSIRPLTNAAVVVIVVVGRILIVGDRLGGGSCVWWMGIWWGVKKRCFLMLCKGYRG